MDNQYSWITIEQLEDGKWGVFRNNKAGVHRLVSQHYEIERAEQAKAKEEALKEKIGNAIANAMNKLMSMSEEERQAVLDKMNKNR